MTRFSPQVSAHRTSSVADHTSAGTPVRSIEVKSNKFGRDGKRTARTATFKQGAFIAVSGNYVGRCLSDWAMIGPLSAFTHG